MNCGVFFKQLALPSIIVTHDWAEALTMGDVMAVISAGDVLQVGAPIEVFSRPHNADVARVVGIETVVKGRVIGSADGMVRVNVNGTTLTAVEAESEGSGSIRLYSIRRCCVGTRCHGEQRAESSCRDRHYDHRCSEH